MQDQDLITILNNVTNAKRSLRDKAATEIRDRPELFPPLVRKVFDVHDQLHIKAAWVLELVCLEDISLLDGSIQTFIRGMSMLTHESALRPVSKICSIWSKHYFDVNPVRFQLPDEDIEQIISVNFDWLIDDHKVATQVFAMETLQLWGNHINWIHDELRSVLQKNADVSSSGYRARARRILKILQINDE
jgi:hypothetical protein